MNNNHFIASIYGLFSIVIFLLIANIFIGSIHIPVHKIINILLTGKSDKESWTNIILNFRLPQALTSIGIGAGLSISGLLMQTLFRNPLVGPNILGLSSGANLGVALIVLTGLTTTSEFFINNFSIWIIVLAASVGAAMALGLIILVSFRIKSTMYLLIIGIMFSSFTAAIVNTLQYFGTDSQIQTYLFWTFGSLGGLSWTQLLLLYSIIIFGSIICYGIVKPLNALLLSEDYATSMGVNIKNTRNLLILSTSIITGVITAFCGPIVFVGLAVPHLTKLIYQTDDHKVLIPRVAILGAIVLLVCDIISQLPGSQSTLPINIITSIIGAPVVIWIIISKSTFNRDL